MPILILMVVSGLIGAFWASSKNKNAALWGILCACFPIIGLLFLAFSGTEETSEEKIANEIVKVSGSQGIVTSPSAGVSATDMKKWETLVELDPEIASAANTVKAYGANYENVLAEKYLALNDKAYLSAAIQKVIEQARAEIAAGDAKKIEEAVFKSNVIETSEMRGRTIYVMKDGKVAIENKDGTHRFFDTKQQALNTLILEQ